MSNEIFLDFFMETWTGRESDSDGEYGGYIESRKRDLTSVTSVAQKKCMSSSDG